MMCWRQEGDENKFNVMFMEGVVSFTLRGVSWVVMMSLEATKKSGDGGGSGVVVER